MPFPRSKKEPLLSMYYPRHARFAEFRSGKDARDVVRDYLVDQA
jgi:hypothetical protein